MKENYEDRTRIFLPRRTYTILRVDGKAFHTLTRGCNKPFDHDLIEQMDATAKYLCEHTQGAQFAYVQSDEISILLTDFSRRNTSAYFDGNLQKIVSVTASMAAAKFNNLRATAIAALRHRLGEAMTSELPLAAFDCRAFTIPDPVEVMNYFIWRNNDASRNSVQMVARSFFSHKELENKGISELHEMMHKIDINWATDYSDGCKNGRLVTKEQYEVCVDYGDDHHEEADRLMTERTRWVINDAGVFTKNPKEITDLIPEHGYE